MELLVDKHEKFFNRVLVMVPQDHAEDHAAVVYFCILGLSLLKRLDDDNRQAASKYVRSLLVPDGSGFSLGPIHGPDEPPNCEAGYFALSIINMIGEPLENFDIDQEKFVATINACNLPNGAFTASPGSELEASVRHCYCALASLHMLGHKLSTEQTEKTLEWLRTLRDPCFGGYGDNFSGSESHTGLTFCALASMALLDHKPECNMPLLQFLARRQAGNGGFNGRINKPVDTCYSFWSLGCLSLVNFLTVADLVSAQQFLLQETQDSLIGGFAKVAGERPDPLHSALALAALSIANHPELASIDVKLCTTKKDKLD